MIVVECGWLLPMTGAPMRRGRVAIDGEQVVAAGEALADREPDLVLPDVAVLPGLVNAHTHLELSYLEGRIPPSDEFLPWVSAMLAIRRNGEEAGNPAVVPAAVRAAAALRASGTLVVGDISNTLLTPAILEEAGLHGVVFHELLGFGAADRVAQVREARAKASGAATSSVRVCLAPHAPYSVSPALFEAIRADLDAHPDSVSTVHVAEGREEVEFIRTGQGPWRGMLESMGVWDREWRAPGTTPVGYLDGLGVFDGRTLAVHGVQTDGQDLARLRASGTTLVSCPRSNAWVGAGSPPVDAFYASRVEVAFGTDSLASVSDLNLFAELAAAHALAPKVPPRWLLESATAVGAAALGVGDRFGTIEAGKRAPLLAVRLPEGVDDPEAYLVSGVDPSSLSWVTDRG